MGRDRAGGLSRQPRRAEPGWDAEDVLKGSRAGAALGWLGFWLGVVCWPVLAGRGARLLGDELGHGWRAMWTADLTASQLAAGQGWPTASVGLGAPVEGHFASPAPLFDAISALLRWVAGPVVTFDLVALGHLALGALGAWVLAIRAGLRWEGALVTGTVFGFNTFLLSAGGASGAPEVLGMAWIPWALAALVWLGRAPGPRSALAAALALVAVSLADLHLALFAPLLVPLILLPGLMDGAREADAGARARLVGWTGLAVVGAALLAVPLLRPLVSALADPGAVGPPGSLSLAPLPAPDDVGRSLISYATLSDALLPGGAMVVGQGAALTTSCVYLGWISLVLAGVGAGLGRLRWVALSGVALVLAMGPYLLITPDGWRPVPVVWYTWLRETWPVYRMITMPVRAMGFGFAGLAVLAGFGAERVIAELPRARAVVPWALSGAILVEIWTLSPVPVQLPTASVWIPAAVTKLSALSEPGAVLDWPAREASGRSELARYAYYQMWHRRPAFFDLSSRAGGVGIESNPFYAALERVTYGDGFRSDRWTGVSKLPVGLGVSALAEMGYGWLVYHPWHVAEDRRAGVLSFLDGTLPLYAEEPDGSRLYQIRGSGPVSALRVR